MYTVEGAYDAVYGLKMVMKVQELLILKIQRYWKPLKLLIGQLRVANLRTRITTYTVTLGTFLGLRSTDKPMVM